MGLERGEQVHVGVAYDRVDANGPERVEHAPAGAQRDFPLVRESAGEDQNVGFHGVDHSSPGAGVFPAAAPNGVAGVQVTPAGAGATVAPNSARTEVSCSITPASRRTPSRIRSGGGKQYDSRMCEPPEPSAKNPVPGTYATRAVIARGSISFECSPSGRVSQT